MIEKPNTKYHIQYDYDLNQREITIPENCVLDFQGGSLKSGILNFNNTKLKGNYNIFKENIDFNGTIQTKVNPKWLKLVYDIEYDNSKNLNSLLLLASLASDKELILEANSFIYVKSHYEGHVGNFLRKGTVFIPSNVILNLNNSTIKSLTNGEKQYNILTSIDTENIIIKNGTIQGERATHTGTGGEWGYGIALQGVKGFTLENLNCIDCWGDGINIQVSVDGDGEFDSQATKLGHCFDGIIYRVICDNNRRQGLSVEGCHRLLIDSCQFSNTKGTAPACGIDFEPYSSKNTCKDVEVVNSVFFKNNQYGILAQPLYDSKIHKCLFYENKTTDLSISGRNLTLENNCNDFSLQTFNTITNLSIINSYIRHLQLANGENTTNLNNKIINCQLGIKYVEKQKYGLIATDHAIKEMELSFNNCDFYIPKKNYSYHSPIQYSKEIDKTLNIQYSDCNFDCTGGTRIFISPMETFTGCTFIEPNINISVFSAKKELQKIKFNNCSISEMYRGEWDYQLFEIPVSLTTDNLISLEFKNLKITSRNLSMWSGLTLINLYKQGTSSCTIQDSEISLYNYPMILNKVFSSNIIRGENIKFTHTNISPLYCITNSPDELYSQRLCYKSFGETETLQLWTGKEWLDINGNPLITYGTEDNKPELSTNNKGFLYFNTTDKTHYMFDGKNWERVQNSSLIKIEREIEEMKNQIDELKKPTV